MQNTSKRSKTRRGPGRPPGSTRDATRQRILSAARACFAEQSFAVTTNRDIAERAGVTPGAIYQYFDSKLALYAAAAREAVVDVVAQMRAHVSVHASTAVALREIVLSLLALQNRDSSLPPFFAALHFESVRNPAIARAIKPDREAILAVMAEVVLAGARSGEIDPLDVPRVVSMFIACTLGLSQLATTIGSEQIADAAKAFGELLDGTLFRAASARAKRPTRAKRPLQERAVTPLRKRRERARVSARRS
jgi:AcrR family transcriptional regulator